MLEGVKQVGRARQVVNEERDDGGGGGGWREW